MTNPFVSKEDSVYAEAMNGALAMFAGGSPRFTVTVPGDCDNAAFAVGKVKTGCMLVELIMSGTVINNNTITLASGSTTGTATFRIYPNIEPFKQWVNFLWTMTATTGIITCSILKNFGMTSVHSNISNPEYLTNEGLGLEYVDFVFTLTQVSGNNPVLNTVQIIFDGGI